MAPHPVGIQARNKSSLEWEEFYHEANRRPLAGVMTGMHVSSARNGPPMRQYEICVRGHLGETMRSAFPAMRAQRRGTDTVLTGALPDPSALYGVLAEIEALGLELIGVRRLG